MADLRITDQMLRVLDVLLADPAADHYGFGVAQATGLQSGTLYPILARMEKLGWVTSTWESPNDEARGPRRRLYRLTREGVEEGTRAVEQARAQQASVLARTLEDFVADGVLDTTMATLLRAAVRTRKNIVVTGPQVAGKTSLLRALCAECDPAASIVSVEQKPELLLDHLPALQSAKGVVSMAVCNATTDAPPTMEDLVVTTARWNTSQLIVGEIRGPEVVAFWLVPETGGVMSTVAAADAYAGVDRLVTMATREGWSDTDHAQRMVADHIDLVVHLDYRPDRGPLDKRRRVISTIIALSPGGEDPTISTTEVYAPDADGNPVPGEVPAAQLVDLIDAGFDYDAYTQRGA